MNSDPNEPLHQSESEHIFHACVVEHGSGEPGDDYFPQTVLNTFFPGGLAIASVEECVYCGVAHEESWDYNAE